MEGLLRQSQLHMAINKCEIFGEEIVDVTALALLDV